MNFQAQVLPHLIVGNDKSQCRWMSKTAERGQQASDMCRRGGIFGFALGWAVGGIINRVDQVRALRHD